MWLSKERKAAVERQSQLDVKDVVAVHICYPLSTSRPN